MIIGDYIYIQKSVNRNLKNAGNQYLIKSKWKSADMGFDITTLSPLAKTMKDEYPNLVANYYRYSPVTNVVSAGENHFKENVNIGDTTLVNMYGFPLLYGNKDKPFANNSSAVITETMALKLFGTKNAIRKPINIQTTAVGISQDYIVSAVLKDIPYNSVVNLLGAKYGGGNYGVSVFIPATGSHYFQNFNFLTNWDDANAVEFIELKAGITPKNLEQSFKQILQKYTPDNIRKNLQIELAPVRSYYIKSDEGGVKEMITILSSVAAFILLMAIINFVNISVGTSSYRLKEIGLRKVFGGSKRQLITQFISEACLLNLIAAFLSIGFYELLRPAFNQVLNTTLDPFINFGFDKLVLFLSLIFFAGILSGFYPAFILSASKVVHSVKGKINSAKDGLQLRKVLLISQFTLAIIVFISSLIISKQVSFVFKKDLGYNKNQVLAITAFPKQWDSAGVEKMRTIRQGLLELPSVKDISLTFEIPDRSPIQTMYLVPENSATTKPFPMQDIDVDENYASVLGIPLLQGTFFTQGQGAFHPNEIVLNESALKAFGWKNAVGKKVKYGDLNYTVAGVVKDFNYSSLHEAITPLVFTHVKDARTYRYLVVKLNAANLSKVIDELKQKWKILSPDAPFEYTFLDETFRAKYQSELQLKKAAGIATALNLIIVFMGIFGVVAFTLTKRTKEIAVRKALGAAVNDILFIFIKEYSILILISNLIAWPLAFIITNYWLQNFAYRIHQGLFYYFLVFVILFLVAIGLIAIQCLKTAFANPVKSLRTE